MTDPVLVVDDNPSNLRLVELALKGNDYPVKTTTSPVKAISLCLTDFPAVLVVDFHMPDINGIDLVKRLAEYDDRVRHTPVLILTGDDEISTKPLDRLISDISVLFKPFDFDELTALVGEKYRTRMRKTA